MFGAQSGMILNYIHPDRVTDFELVMVRVGDALANSPNPMRRRMAAGWQVFRAAQPAANDSVLYVWLIDPTVPREKYNIALILSQELPGEFTTLYEAFDSSLAAPQSVVDLYLVNDFAAR